MSADDGQGFPPTIGMPDVQNTDMPPEHTTIGLSPEQMASIPKKNEEAAQQDQQNRNRKRKSTAGALGSVVLFLIIAGAVAYLIAPSYFIQNTSTSTVTATTTIPQVRTEGCGTVTSPGPYHIINSVKYKNETGACLVINASDVKVTCESNVALVGSGPFGDQSPFSYGIEVKGADNVSIVGCSINNFSYGIMAISADNLTIQGNNVSSNYVSDIYLNASPNSRITHNYISRAESKEGAIYISPGSTGTNVTNNTVQFNTFMGIIVNSTSNIFTNNRVNGTPISFYCGLNSSFPTRSYASGNVCYNNTGCGFLACLGNNIPANISKIVLGSSISSCGAINSPGTYTLAGNIDMRQFVNVGSLSGPQADTPCIRIDSNNVRLNCDNFTISHATIGLQFQQGTGLTLNGCNFVNSSVGLYLSEIGATHIQNVTFSGNNKAFLISNSTTTFISTIKAHNNTFGVYLNNSQDIEVNNFTVSNNTYGFYLNNSVGSVFNIGKAFNNSQIDFYSSPNYVGTSYETMESTECGFTNAQWATCNVHSNPSTQNRTVTYCQDIKQPGVYVVPRRLLGTPNCINIDTNNVKLSCDGNIIQPINPTTSYAIYAKGKTNVTVDNCKIYGYGIGVQGINLTDFNVSSLTIKNAIQGIDLTGVGRSMIYNNTINGSTDAGISLAKTNYSTVIKNGLYYGSVSGLIVNGSMHNIIMNNTGHSNALGINITGASKNNTIIYNSFSNSGISDYMCAAQDGSLMAERGRINYGFTKGSCSWMAVVPKASPEVTCSAGLTSDSYALTTDGLYNFNSTCYSILAGGSTVNCMGHMVIATNGGTFASFTNSAGSKMENCVLIGFITPVIVHNSSVTIINNTILVNSSSIFHKGAWAINMTSTHNNYIRYNNITTIENGIGIGNSTATLVQYNNVNATGVSYDIYNSIGVSGNQNMVLNASATGIELVNSTGGTFQGNNFGKLLCLGQSAASDSNVDQGANKCTINNGCAWISDSSSSCT